ncbi:MAG: bisanhydrobacterioruberin hydratase [Halobacteriaceae archaeon]
MDRADVEQRLDALVLENRFTIAVLFPAVGAVLLAGSAAGLVPEPFKFNPYLILLGTAVMRLPLVAGLAPLIDRRAAGALLALTAYTYLIELVGVRTGYPYGEFEYLIELGPMLAGAVPAGLPIFFFPLVLNAYLLVLLVGPGTRGGRFLATAAMVVGLDLVLDPAAVALGFWEYRAGGLYYDVPVQNFAGWVLSAVVAVGLLEVGLPTDAVQARLRTCAFMLDDMVSFVILWGAINAYYLNLVPLLLAVGLFGALRTADRFDIPLPGRQARPG